MLQIQILTILLLILEIFSATCPCSDQKLCEPIQTGPRKELFIFGGGNYKDYPQDLAWDKITTIAWWPPEGGWNPEIICYAHAKGVRVVKGAFYTTENLANETYMDEWIKSQVAEVKEKFMDGINFDFEDAIPEGSNNSLLLTQLSKRLTEAVHSAIPGSQVTFDVGWKPGCLDVRCYDYYGLAEANDFLIMMDYDEQSQIFGPCKAGPNSPLYYAIEGVIGFFEIGITPDKLVMAVPWYGHDFTCLKPINETVCPLEFHPWRGVSCTDYLQPERSYVVCSIFNSFITRGLLNVCEKTSCEKKILRNIIALDKLTDNVSQNLRNFKTPTSCDG